MIYYVILATMMVVAAVLSENIYFLAGLILVFFSAEQKYSDLEDKVDFFEIKLNKIIQNNGVLIVHGVWDESEHGYEVYKCSVCGGGCWYHNYQEETLRSRLCPNCGTRMREKR